MDVDVLLAGIWVDMPASDDVDENLEWFQRLTRTQRIIYSTHYLCEEVQNGGFHQYFHNSTGLTAPEAVESFRVLELPDIAELVEKAMLVFGSEFPRERRRRQEFLDSFSGEAPSEWNPFFLLDERFYAVIKIRGAPPLHDGDRYTLAAKEFLRYDAKAEE